MQKQGYLAPLFYPSSIAVIGASEHSRKAGHLILSNLQSAGFKGKIFPINHKGGSILGLETFRKVEDIPDDLIPLDLAVICIPSQGIAALMGPLASRGCKAAIVISSGFKETGSRGALLEEKLGEAARQHNISLLGPNTLGLINTRASLNATLSPGVPPVGNIGFFSQSGALSVSFIDWARNENIGFSSFVSLGSRPVLDECDMLAYFAQDPGTKVIAGYLESIEHGRRFLQQAQIVTRQKPVILLRAGSTSAGARAVSARSGALDGLDTAYEAAFKQSGIIRATQIEELFHLTQAFATQALPQGPGLGIVTNAGGPGIVAADACAKAGLSMASFSAQTANALKEALPPTASLFNPVDVLAVSEPRVIASAVDFVLADQRVQSLLVLVTPALKATADDTAAALLEIYKKHPRKPIFTCFMGGKTILPARHILFEAGYPCYRFPESAVTAIAAMYRYSLWKGKPLPVEVGYRRDLNKAHKVIHEARSAGAAELVEFQAQELFAAYEMPMLRSKLARTSEEAVQIAKQIGQPVALKIASPQIPHKTDVNGVMLGLENAASIRNAFMEITARAKKLRREAYIAGCMVQAMAPSGAHEIIVGLKRDVRFGPMIFFGYGGVHLEVFKDLSCRIAPLSLEDVNSMIHEIRAFPLLTGLRGQKPIKFAALEDVLLIMSQIAQDFPEIQEATCNPVLVGERGAVVADMRVILEK